MVGRWVQLLLWLSDVFFPVRPFVLLACVCVAVHESETDRKEGNLPPFLLLSSVSSPIGCDRGEKKQERGPHTDLRRWKVFKSQFE